MAGVERASDAVARRILGVIVFFGGLATPYFGGYMIVMRGHGHWMDPAWIERLGASSRQFRPDVGHGIAAVGLLLTIIGLVTTLRPARIEAKTSPPRT
jgi:hypothetical protein